MTPLLQLKSKILKSQFGQRLDKALVELFPNYSRSYIKKLILNNKVEINNKIINEPKKKMFGCEQIVIHIFNEVNIHSRPQKIPLDIIYEDDEILVINKPQNLVVHPGAGNLDGTVLNALLYYYPKIIHVPRAGIVHRLDKNTTGLMVITKTIFAQMSLVKDLKLRKIIRIYEAIINGCISTDGIIDMPISRHPIKRTCMAINLMGKPAITHYKVIECFRAHTRLKVKLETGRTHQIRVHMAYINHPLVGDLVYGHRLKLLKNFSKEFNCVINNFNRQALHATTLSLYHPRTGIKMKWHIDIPTDMIMLINLLKSDKITYKNKINL
ncbi:MAG: 23S rRNA pseudouridine(1911/1915/1917) synthase RluD [Arsenophonus endosymbiont of Ceratovacuna japonica]